MDRSIENYFGERSILSLVRVSGIAVLLQLIFVIIGFIISATYGAVPSSALEAYEIMGKSRIIGLLRDDSYNLMIISLYLFSFTGLFFLVMRNKFALSLFAILLTYIAVILCISSHSGFSLMHLSEQYLKSSDETVKIQLIAAGESVMAQNIWNSTSGFFSGVFLQGGGVLMSVAMLGDKNFRKLTIFSGIIANGLDLFQHLIHYSIPSIALIIQYISGPFYIVWFIMLSLDLFRFVKCTSETLES